MEMDNPLWQPLMGEAARRKRIIHSSTDLILFFLCCMFLLASRLPASPVAMFVFHLDLGVELVRLCVLVVAVVGPRMWLIVETVHLNNNKSSVALKSLGTRAQKRKKTGYHFQDTGTYRSHHQFAEPSTIKVEKQLSKDMFLDLYGKKQDFHKLLMSLGVCSKCQGHQHCPTEKACMLYFWEYKAAVNGYVYMACIRSCL